MIPVADLICPGTKKMVGFGADVTRQIPVSDQSSHLVPTVSAQDLQLPEAKVAQ
jgi:hypothetical protein